MRKLPPFMIFLTLTMFTIYFVVGMVVVNSPTKERTITTNNHTFVVNEPDFSSPFWSFILKLVPYTFVGCFVVGIPTIVVLVREKEEEE